MSAVICFVFMFVAGVFGGLLDEENGRAELMLVQSIAATIVGILLSPVFGWGILIGPLGMLWVGFWLAWAVKEGKKQKSKKKTKGA